MREHLPVPVILDTDIGGDIDDTWALLMLLKSPELDLRYVSTCTGDTTYRAKICAKFLELCGRPDVPVGIGPQGESKGYPQGDWVADYRLSSYPGRIDSDGVEGLIKTVMQSPEPVTIIAIGPFTTIAAALKREPRIADKSRIVAMVGNVRRLHEGCEKIVPEYNVLADVAASRDVFNASWPMTIAPLDSCGIIKLIDENYRTVARSVDPTVRALIENYRIWCGHRNNDWYAHGSTILFDTLAVYLAFTEQHLVMEDHRLVIEDDGLTAINPKGKSVRCANDWTDLNAYHSFLVERLVNGNIVKAVSNPATKAGAR
jgi:inosine-uridine nucleoside N-ribohydrolase